MFFIRAAVFGPLALLILAAPSRAEPSFAARLVDAAIERTQQNVSYDPAYRLISYPGGDVPDHLGVCTDVIVRSYRALGIDLQQLVHEDMAAHFSRYPKTWSLTRPDSNIDHRRVPNLRVFFTRHGTSLPISDRAADYKPGDIVTWNIANGWRSLQKGRRNIPHIGIVTDRKASNGTPLMVHNIGGGTALENMLFSYEITGHYRYGAVNTLPNEAP